jgi:two-component system chemotaxis sensor kinase CheA
VTVELDRDALMPTFLAEAEEQLEALEQTLLALDRAPSGRDATESVAELFRLAHTLKGNAESLGLSVLGQVAHALEGVLDAVRGRKATVSPALVGVLLGGHDALRSILAHIVDGGTPQAEAYEDVLQALVEAATTGPSATSLLPAARTAATGPGAVGGRKSLRVDLDALDQMVTCTGQLSIAFARLRSLVHPKADAQDAFAEVERLFGDLREQAMTLRLVPIGPLLRQQMRSVRDLATAHGKLVRLVVEDDDVEVDASVLEGLRDPVTHMVRNAVDHALERPEVRRSAGKDAVGTVTLKTRYEAGWVTLEVSDDGAGFDRKRIRARGLEMGLLAEGAVARDDDLLRLVLQPGFSTAPAVTRVSGRGVGMDVVARNVAALKGFVAIRSTEGAGTTVTLRVPLTLAILSGFAVDTNAETFVIPMDAVRECVALPGAEERADRMLLNLRGEPLACVRLGQLLRLGEHTAPTESVVVLEHEGARAGLVVDTLVGGTEAVVKPLGGSLEGIHGIAGSTILGDGRVALILDVPAIVRGAVEGAAA